MSFRSHLMQQFAAAARQQSRPPLALAPLYGDGGSSSAASPQRRRRMTPAAAAASPALARRGPSTGTSTAVAAATRRISTVRISPTHSPTGNIAAGNESDEQRGCTSLSISRSLSSLTATSLEAAEAEGKATKRNDETILEPPSIPELQQSFQNILKSRRTVSNFLQHSESSGEHLRSAISRAVQCAVEAPNHKRTEPYTFTRLIAPSAATKALANVCYHVSVRRMREKQKGSEKTLLAEAERKRDRWRSIPAFLVASVGGMPDQVPPEEYALNEEEGSEYAQLPFVPPQTELQLENYAASCAATQNVLLSLHSEHLGSKWATGPVIRTKAFRDVVQLRNDELVVGLIMVGVPKRVPRSPRKRRALEGDVLKDL